MSLLQRFAGDLLPCYSLLYYFLICAVPLLDTLSTSQPVATTKPVLAYHWKSGDSCSAVLSENGKYVIIVISF